MPNLQIAVGQSICFGKSEYSSYYNRGLYEKLDKDDFRHDSDLYEKVMEEIDVTTSKIQEKIDPNHLKPLNTNETTAGSKQKTDQNVGHRIEPMRKTL